MAAKIEVTLTKASFIVCLAASGRSFSHKDSKVAVVLITVSGVTSVFRAAGEMSANGFTQQCV